MSGHLQKRSRRDDSETAGTSESSASHSSNKSPLWQCLLQRYGWGNMSAAEVQQLAQAAVRSGAKGQDLDDLAALGAHGNSLGNAQRDLTRLLFNEVAAPLPVKTQTFLSAADGVKLRDCELMLPHDWIAALFEHGVSNQLLGLQRRSLFWNQMDWDNNPQIHESISFFGSIDFDKEVVVPLLLHGDGAPHTETDSLLVLSMRSILSEQNVSLSQFLLMALPKSCMVASSLDRVWQMLVWSFNALAMGVHPDKDVDGRSYSTMPCKSAEEERRFLLAGKPLGGSMKIRCIIMVVAGDIEWFCSQFGFPYAMANNPCPYCKADNLRVNSQRPFTDFRSNAKWKTTVLKPHELKAKYGNHPLMQVMGVNVFSIKLDTLHLVDLGVAAHTFGNLLFEIMEDSLVGNRTTSLQELNKLVADAYESLKIPVKNRVGALKLSNLKAGASDYPTLSHIKGRKIRWFSKVAVVLATNFKNESKATHHRLACVKAIDTLYTCLDDPALVYPASLQELFSKSVEAFLAHYGCLATLSMEAGQCRYSIVQKHHLLAHLPSQSKFIAPRCAWTYGGESFMGLMVRLSALCVQGTAPWRMSAKLYQKNRLAMHLIWKYGLCYDDDNADETE